MKYVFALMITSVSLLLVPSSCATTVSHEELDALKTDLENAQIRISELSQNLTAIRDEHSKLQANYEALQAQGHVNIFAEIEGRG